MHTLLALIVAALGYISAKHGLEKGYFGEYFFGAICLVVSVGMFLFYITNYSACLY